MSDGNINDNSVFNKQALSRRLTELLDTYAEEVKEEEVWDICKPKIKSLGSKPIYTVSVDPYKEDGSGSMSVFGNVGGKYRFIKSENI